MIKWLIELSKIQIQFARRIAIYQGTNVVRFHSRIHLSGRTSTPKIATPMIEGIPQILVHKYHKYHKYTIDGTSYIEGLGKRHVLTHSDESEPLIYVMVLIFKATINDAIITGLRIAKGLGFAPPRLKSIVIPNLWSIRSKESTRLEVVNQPYWHFLVLFGLRVHLLSLACLS